MGNRKSLTNEDGEVRELKAKDFLHFKPVSSLPESLAHKLGVRGQQKAPTKERITIRLSHDVVNTFRSTGSGWQTRMDEVLKEWVDAHAP